MHNLTDVLDMTGLSDPGLVRTHNEDAIMADPALGLVILADGMGGYKAGEVASGMAVSMIATGLREQLALHESHRFDFTRSQSMGQSLIEDEVLKANRAILERANSDSECSGMGTTLVVGLFYDNRLAVAHIGDSRVYRSRAGVMEQLTRDHSLLQEQIDSGLISQEEARYAQNKNLVTRALGIDEVVDVELHDHQVLPGDVYLLCSDGLNDMLEDADIAGVLHQPAASLSVMASQLVHMANEQGGRDNVSVLLVRVKQAYPVQTSMWSRFKAWWHHR